MRVAVTGANGLLGTALCSVLEETDYDVIPVTRKDVDLLDGHATRDWFAKNAPEFVIHTAARVHGLMGNREFPANVFEENAQININVITAGRLNGVAKFIGAGTVAAYPGGLVTDIHEADFLSGEPHAGERAYAYAKRAMLAHLDAVKMQYGIPYAYGVLTNLYGPRDRFDTQHGHVIPSLIAKFHEAKRTSSAVDVWGAGKAERDFLYIDDAARALVHLLGQGEGVFNIATGSTVPIGLVVDHLSKITGVTDINWQPEKPEGQLKRSYNVSRLEKLGYKTSWSLEDGLAQTYSWYSENIDIARSN